MLGWRLALSAVLIPAFFGVFYLDHRLGAGAPLLLVLCLLLAGRAAWEMADLLRVRSFRPQTLLVIVLTLLVVASAWVPRFGENGEHAHDASVAAVASALTLAVLVLFLAGAIRYREAGSSMETLAAELLTVCYVGLLLAITAQLRWVAGAQAGYLVLGSMIIAAKMGDTGAYTVGRLFGKAKLCPALSPGKTRAGGLGALLGAALGAGLWLSFAPPLFGEGWSCPLGWSLVYGTIIGLVGLIGDLCESLIKRDTGKKDSAQLMPGFGGLLDLLDSILYTGPVAVGLWWFLPLATWK